MIKNPLKLSKNFHFPRGHIDFATPTVGDMIEFLSQLPSDMPIVAEWEGIQSGIKFDRIEQNFSRGFEDDACDTLILNTDTY